MKNVISLALICLLSLFLLTGCYSNPYKVVKETNRNIDDNAQNINEANRLLAAREPPVIVKHDNYVNPTPISPNSSPAWLQTPISLRAQGIPLRLLVSRILRNTPATVSYQPSIQIDQPVTINYHGTIRGALTELSNRTNYAFQVNGNEVDWQSFVVRTFDISFMPGSATYMVGQNAGGSPGSSNASGSGDIVSVHGNLGNEQYSNLKAQLSVWADLQNTLNSLKSADGKVTVSESTTTVTVMDHPSNVKAIAQYIKQLNRAMTRQVSIQVSVLELQLNKEFNYGIDWNLLQAALGTQFAINGQAGTAADVSNSTLANGLVTLTIGKPDSNAIIRALSVQGKLSIVTQPTMVTTNNQVAEVRITKDTGFLQSITTTTAVNAGTSTSLTPGMVTDGFTLYLLPKIQDDKIYLQISSTLSNLLTLAEVNNKGTTTPSKDNENSSNFQSIQVPTLTEKHFNQRAVLESGTTLIITGFQQLRDQENTVAPFGIEALGGKGAQTQNIQTIVCITPTIIQGHN